MDKILKRNSGITLISLVITIIVLLILASVGTYSGMEAIKNSKYTKFTAELRIMQTYVNNWYEELQPTDVVASEYDNAFAQNISNKFEVVGVNATKANLDNQAKVALDAISDSDYEDYYVLDGNVKKALNIEGVDQDVLINIKKRKVVSKFGENNTFGERVYVLDDEDIYNVTYNADKSSGTVTFDVTQENIGNGRAKIIISNINYAGYNNKWNVKYKLDDVWYDAKNANFDGETITFIVNKSGTYTVALQNEAIYGIGEPEECAVAVDDNSSGTVPKIADLIPGENDTVTALNENANTTIQDIYGNNVIIPAGFGIAKESGVSVQEGIVIEDAFSTGTDADKKGSQFVWVPVGTFNIGDGEKVTGTKTVNLNRYDWSTNPVTTVTDGSAVKNKSTDSYEFTELTTGEHPTVARTIGEGDNKKIEAVEKAKAKGGFYIGKFETGTGNVCKYDVATYTNVTRDTAKTQAQNMYTGKETLYKSDLMNSYAWDTAIDFIQQCGTASNHATYSRTIGQSTTRANTGKNLLNATNAVDVQCNIYDMAGNVYEWTTEYASYTDYYGSAYPCVYRGGDYYNDSDYTARRNNSRATVSGDRIGFRPLLYVM